LVTIVSNDNHLDICPVIAVQRIVEQAKRLGQSVSEPLAVFLNHHDLKKNLTGNEIAKILQQDWSILTCQKTKSAISHHIQEECWP
jgi:hypothetical protein